MTPSNDVTVLGWWWSQKQASPRTCREIWITVCFLVILTLSLRMCSIHLNSMFSSHAFSQITAYHCIPRMQSFNDKQPLEKIGEGPLPDPGKQSHLHNQCPTIVQHGLIFTQYSWCQLDTPWITGKKGHQLQASVNIAKKRYSQISLKGGLQGIRDLDQSWEWPPWVPVATGGKCELKDAFRYTCKPMVL